MFGLGGFDFGASSMPSLTSLGFASSSGGVGLATPVSSPVQTSWWQTLINDGLGAYNMVAKNDLASQQIKAGQYPTVLGLPGMSSVSNISSSWVMIAIILVVVIVLIRS